MGEKQSCKKTGKNCLRVKRRQFLTRWLQQIQPNTEYSKTLIYDDPNVVCMHDVKTSDIDDVNDDNVFTFHRDVFLVFAPSQLFILFPLFLFCKKIYPNKKVEKVGKLTKSWFFNISWLLGVFKFVLYQCM